MNEQKRMRVGLVGCGYHGFSLAQAVNQIEPLQLVACVDLDLTVARQVARLARGAAAYESLEEMLAAVPLDAVILATPPHILYETALVAVHAGKHVLAEKPIGLDEKEAAQLEEAVARSGVCYMAGYSFRFCPALQQMHALLQGGAVGEIQAIQGSIGVGPLSSGWHATPATGGGPLLYVGSHLIDEILWFIDDEPVEVIARIRYRADTQADETTTFGLRFAKGAAAQCLVTQASNGFVNHLEIYGRDGRISLRGVDYLNYAVGVISRNLPAYAEPVTIQPRVQGDLKQAMLTAELTEFAQAIGEQRQPAITIRDGRRVLRILDAVRKADRTGERVRLG